MSRSPSHCPGCGRKLPVGPRSPWRPFCSERCRLLDLGAWLDGRRAIPGEKAEPPGDSEPHEDSPQGS